jgi:hypothetical protein
VVGGGESAFPSIHYLALKHVRRRRTYDRKLDLAFPAIHELPNRPQAVGYGIVHEIVIVVVVDRLPALLRWHKVVVIQVVRIDILCDQRGIPARVSSAQTEYRWLRGMRGLTSSTLPLLGFALLLPLEATAGVTLLLAASSEPLEFEGPA